MDTKAYLYLTTVERCRSVSRAAKELDMTPQGLARAVRRLEDDLGCAFYTGGLGTSDLTEQGRCVLEHGQAMIDEERAMLAELKAIAGHAANIIRLGCSTGLLGYLGEGVFGQATEQRGFQVFVSEELPDSECERRLVCGEYDYALLVNPPDPSLASICVVQDYQFVWVNRADPLARQDEVSLSDLDGRTIYSLNDEYRNTGLLLKLCAEAGSSPKFRFTSEMIRVYECARAGMGLGLTCRNHIEATAESQKTVGVPIRELPWGFSICWRQDTAPTEAQQWFLSYMRTLHRVYT